MKRSLAVSHLDQMYVDMLQRLSPPRLYQSESEIIYHGHIPTAGYLLIQGEIEFLKRKRVIKTIKGNSLFGVTELMENRPMKYTVRIKANSKVCILDRSTIQEVLNKINEDYLPEVFKEIVA